MDEATINRLGAQIAASAKPATTPRELPPVAWMMTCDQYRRPPEFYSKEPIGVPPICKVVALVSMDDYAALATRLAESEARAEEYKAADESMQAEVGRLHAELHKLRAEIAGAPVVEVIEHEVVEVDARRIETWGAIPFVDASMISQRVALLRLPAGEPGEAA